MIVVLRFGGHIIYLEIDFLISKNKPKPSGQDCVVYFALKIQDSSRFVKGNRVWLINVHRYVI